jgi:hypothetical protein
MIIAASDLAMVIQRRIAEERSGRLTRITHGMPADFASYKEDVGFIKALQVIDDYINELRKHKGEIGE